MKHFFIRELDTPFAESRVHSQLDNFAGTKFRMAFLRWLLEAGKVADGELSFTVGNKFIRIVDHADNGRSSAYGFVDKNGDVLMAATWTRPAKHARGNIFNANKPADGAGKWGVLYMDELRKQTKG